MAVSCVVNIYGTCETHPVALAYKTVFGIPLGWNLLYLDFFSAYSLSFKVLM